jgi:lambda repressor-like predicted transcriptional regulator
MKWMSKVVMTMGLSEPDVGVGAREVVDEQRRANQEDVPVTDHGRGDVAIEWTLVFHERAGGLMVVLSPELLKVACAARGWSLTHLAVRAGISRPTLRTVLKGHPVRPRTMWKLANALSRAPVSRELAQFLRVS